MKTASRATTAEKRWAGAGLQSTRGLKSWQQHKKKNRQAPKPRLIVTSHDIQGVNWLEDLDKEITWIQGDPIQEISKQLQQKQQKGNPASELHIVAHGSEGEVKLGNTVLDTTYFEHAAQQLEEWTLEQSYFGASKQDKTSNSRRRSKNCQELMFSQANQKSTAINAHF